MEFIAEVDLEALDLQGSRGVWLELDNLKLEDYSMIAIYFYGYTTNNGPQPYMALNTMNGRHHHGLYESYGSTQTSSFSSNSATMFLRGANAAQAGSNSSQMSYIYIWNPGNTSYYKKMFARAMGWRGAQAYGYDSDYLGFCWATQDSMRKLNVYVHYCMTGKVRVYGFRKA